LWATEGNISNSVFEFSAQTALPVPDPSGDGSGNMTFGQQTALSVIARIMPSIVMFGVLVSCLFELPIFALL